METLISSTKPVRGGRVRCPRTCVLGSRGILNGDPRFLAGHLGGAQGRCTESLEAALPRREKIRIECGKSLIGPHYTLGIKD